MAYNDKASYGGSPLCTSFGHMKSVTQIWMIRETSRVARDLVGVFAERDLQVTCMWQICKSLKFGEVEWRENDKRDKLRHKRPICQIWVPCNSLSLHASDLYVAKETYSRSLSLLSLQRPVSLWRKRPINHSDVAKETYGRSLSLLSLQRPVSVWRKRLTNNSNVAKETYRRGLSLLSLQRPASCHSKWATWVLNHKET